MKYMTAVIPKSQYRKPAVRHITYDLTYANAICGEWLSGGWKVSTKPETLELRICSKCDKKIQRLLDSARADPLLGGESKEPMKAQIWRERNSKRRKRTAVITKVTDDEIWVKAVTDINGKEIAPVMRQRKATRIPIEHWSRDWIPA